MMKETNSMVLFSRGPFSQWHMSTFVVDGVRYNCAEQYMMAQKAVFFFDTETLKKIMKATTPKEQKALGRQVKGFLTKEWDKVSRDFVFKGNLAKFSQNKQLKKKLLETGGAILVEASPNDKKWGIGLAKDNPLAQDKSKWQGTNWLGETLMRVRTSLRK